MFFFLKKECNTLCECEIWWKSEIRKLVKRKEERWNPEKDFPESF